MQVKNTFIVLVETRKQVMYETFDIKFFLFNGSFLEEISAERAASLLNQQ